MVKTFLPAIQVTKQGMIYTFNRVTVEPYGRLSRNRFRRTRAWRTTVPDTTNSDQACTV